MLDAILARSSDMVFITENVWRPEIPGRPIIYANDTLLRHLGFERDQLIGSGAQVFHGPRTSMDTVERILAAQSVGQPFRGLVIIRNAGDQELEVEIDVAPVFSEDGSISNWFCIIRDMTERQRFAREARLSAERFELVTRASSDVLWDWDAENDGMWWSDRLEAVLGIDPESMPTLGASIAHIVESERDAVQAQFASFLAGRDTAWRAEFGMVRPDGTTAHVSSRALVVRGLDGHAIRVVGSFTDQTERRAIEDHLRQAQKLEAVGQLTAGIAHDFNNILTTILTNTEVIVDELEPDTDLHALASLSMNAARRGAELTSRLLAFGRRQTLRPETVDVERLIREMAAMLRRTLPESITVSLTVESGLACARVDAGQLEAAILNLALNAKDAMPDGGHLTIAAASVAKAPGGASIAISVIDDGCGMPDHIVQRAFDPFFTTKAAGRGTGLGLSMVYGFIEQSGGRVGIHSTPGAGTEVTLMLPQAPEGDRERVAPKPSASGLPRGAETILAVEDDDLVRVNVESQLRRLGYHVLIASNAAMGLELLAAEPGIDLLFTDIVMPGGIDGAELGRRAKAMRPDLRILYTSGYFDETAMPAGAITERRNLLRKPYRRGELATAIRAALDT